MPHSLKSVNSPSQQLQHFTNRENEQEILRRVLDLPHGHPLPVVMFWGVGGNGKSWLLRKLRETLPPTLPSALLDFDPMIGGTPYHTDSARALAELRHQLAAVAFPRFDLAYAWLRFKEGVKDEPLLRGSGATAKVFEFISAIVPGLLSEIPLVGWFLNQGAGLVKKHLKGTALERWLSEKVGQEDFQRLRKATSQDVYGELTNRFLQDAAENLPQRAGKACRGVLFLDTFEALRAGVQGQAQAGYREAWVRDLHATDSPLLIVLAGRDQLRWDEFDPGYADPKHLEHHLVGGLSADHARDFLGKCGITDRRLQDAVLRVSADPGTGSADGEPAYHPFCLGLCADTVHADTAGGGTVDAATFDMAPGDTGKLAQRFLKSLNDPAHEVWVKRLALTPRFDEAAARAAFSRDPGAPQDAAWQALLGYSFVRVTDDPGWWAFHARMSDALADGSSAPEGHRLWAEYWRGRSQAETDDFAALAWYHRFCLEPEAARSEWETLAQRRREECRMAEHYALLSWWEPTGVMTTIALTRSEAANLVALGRGYIETTVGNRSENLRRAVERFTLALRIYTEPDFPQDWASVQNDLGTAYRHLPTGDRAANLGRAIACYEEALRVSTEANFPQAWAATQHNLGCAYSELQTGDRAANLRRAIACYEAALRVRTEACSSRDWALTLNNLGAAYNSLPVGDRGENARRAIACYEAALRAYTKADFPSAWAMIQYNLGVTYLRLLTGDRGENLRRAIASFEAALHIYTKSDYPEDWAMTQMALGNAYCQLPTGDRGENARRAIACYQVALRIYTEPDFPQSWALTQQNLGNAYCQLPTGDRGENARRAIACYRDALRVYTEVDFPWDWAKIQYNLGVTYQQLSVGDAGENLRKAIACYEAALRVRTEKDFPQAWAATQYNLGIAYHDLPDEDRGESLHRAFLCFAAALRVYTEAAFPREWAMIQHNLGTVYSELPTGDRGQNLHRAFLCFAAALRVRTKADFPQDWAETQHSLGIVYRHLPTGDRRKNLSRAIACFEDALRVRTEVRFPSEWATTQYELGNAYLARLQVGVNPLDLQNALACFEAAERVFRKVGMLVEAEKTRRQAEDARGI